MAKPAERLKKPPPHFEAVLVENGSWEVRIKLGRTWYTAADCYAVPRFGDARAVAERIADALNHGVLHGQ